MLWNNLQTQTIELGWDFYVPVLLFVVLVATATPVWAAIGVAAVAMLMISGALPLSLVGESLFHGIDHFALTAVPLFILTGDVLVRTGLSRKFLDVAEALTQFAKGGFGSATVLVCGMFAAISGSDAAGAAAVGRMTISRLVESGYPRPLCACACCCGCLYGYFDPTIYCLYCYRPCAGHIGLNIVPSCCDTGYCYSDFNSDHKYHHE